MIDEWTFTISTSRGGLLLAEHKEVQLIGPTRVYFDNPLVNDPNWIVFGITYPDRGNDYVRMLISRRWPRCVIDTENSDCIFMPVEDFILMKLAAQ